MFPCRDCHERSSSSQLSHIHVLRPGDREYHLAVKNTRCKKIYTNIPVYAGWAFIVGGIRRLITSSGTCVDVFTLMSKFAVLPVDPR